MLHQFIAAHREEITDRIRKRVRDRAVPKSIEQKLENGVPIFLTQLTDALVPAEANALHPLGPADSRKRISDSAALNGQALLKQGFTVAQVVHGYGDVCQVVTQLATEAGAPISSEDFHVFNGCLDDAIAGAVTAFGRQREVDLAFAGTERLGVLAHELRNLLNTAVLSFDVIQKGMVGVAGSTAAVHARSLSGLRALVERSLAEARLEAGEPRIKRVSLAEFIEEIEITAAMQAEGSGVALTVNPVDSDLVVDADWQLLESALSNLLQNAFKYTRARGRVTLATRATADRVLIEVCDECGGLPPGDPEDLFRAFARGASDQPGLGLGLPIARGAVRANSGEIHVRNVPGKGCVFTIDLPRQSPLPQAATQV